MRGMDKLLPIILLQYTKQIQVGETKRCLQRLPFVYVYIYADSAVNTFHPLKIWQLLLWTWGGRPGGGGSSCSSCCEEQSHSKKSTEARGHAVCDARYGHTNTYTSKKLCLTPEKEEIPTQCYSALKLAVAPLWSEHFQTNKQTNDRPCFYCRIYSLLMPVVC